MTPTPQPSAAHSPAPPTLRDRATRAVRAEVAAVAMRLFMAQGFDKTTVDQIAAEAGLSRTSFFRYFATKEDVVLGHLDEVGLRVVDALAARPDDEPTWQALRHALDLVIAGTVTQPVLALSTARMLNDTPSLKVRQLGKQLTWQDQLVPEVARRLNVAADAHDPRPRALVAAALACLNAAFDTWNATDGTLDLPTLLDRAMSAPMA